MIVIVKMKNMSGKKDFKKCSIRDRSFIEVDDSNRKISSNALKLGDIEGVISITNGTFNVKPVQDWLEEAQEKIFWNALA